MAMILRPGVADRGRIELDVSRARFTISKFNSLLSFNHFTYYEIVTLADPIHGYGLLVLRKGNQPRPPAAATITATMAQQSRQPNPTRLTTVYTSIRH
jgi:hypothetical protein